MKMAMARVFVLVLWGTVAALAAPNAEPPAPPQISPIERGFLSLSEDDRKAAQDALGWLGFYNGVVDGAAGKRTLDALAAYRKSVNAAADSAPNADEIAALREAAAKAKAAVGFRVVNDAGTGIAVGVPLKLLDTNKPGASQYASGDGTTLLTLEKTSGDLAAAFKTMSADAGARKASYKYLKAGEFFVVAGEEGDAKFYRRYAVKVGELRGLAFVYPKKRAKALDPVALAIANSFDPFPAKAAPVAPPPPPPPPKLMATALVIAPGVAVTRLDSASCPAPTIAGKPVKFLEPQDGLTRLGGDFGQGAAPPPSGGEGDDLVALSLALDGGREGLRATPVRRLDGARVLAALPASAAGAPLFDRQGRLAGFVEAGGGDVRRGQVTLAALHKTLPAAAFGAAAVAAGAALPTAEIARLRRKAILGVFCAA